MNLVIDVGNTETVVGLCRDGEVVEHWRVSTATRRTADEYALLLHQLLADRGRGEDDVGLAVVGSVVPPVTDALRDAIRRRYSVDPVTVDADTPLPIRLDVDEPRTVGADRIANTLAASRLFGRDTVVVDLGTATTFDCITGDGVFIGGVIAPGVLAGQEWLVRRTAKLPRVELDRPERVIGRRTETCLRSGIFYASVETIDGVVDRIRGEWAAEDALVVATGGLAPVLAPACATVDRVEAFLTLRGLDLAGRHASDSGR